MLFSMLTAVAALTAPPTTDDLTWMAGYWLSCADGEVSETWSDPRAGLMVGQGMTVPTTGRPTFEMFHIAAHGGGIAYFTQPGGQPAIIFPATEADRTHVVFENPTHDFPQRIIYRLDGADMVARIEGRMNGRDESMEWRYRPAPLNTRCPRPTQPG
jgi:hypothetical protein